MSRVKVLYMGLFLKDSEFGILDNQIEDQHVTVHFMPPEGTCWPREMEGKTVYLEVTHYAISDRAEGYGVKLPDEIKPFYKNVARPHITLSVANGAKPVETGKLYFAEAPMPKTVEAFVGYMTNQGVMISLP